MLAKAGNSTSAEQLLIPKGWHINDVIQSLSGEKWWKSWNLMWWHSYEKAEVDVTLQACCGLSALTVATLFMQSVEINTNIFYFFLNHCVLFKCSINLKKWLLKFIFIVQNNNNIQDENDEDTNNGPWDSKSASEKNVAEKNFFFGN